MLYYYLRRKPNGSYYFREISIKDTEALTTLLTKIYDESDYTLYNPGEFNPSVSSIS